MQNSILQPDRETCYLCGRYELPTDPLDRHHVFFGPYRQNAERYGLTVYLHHNACHIYGRNAVHANSRVCRELQAEAQGIAMERYGWTTEEFIKLFGKNYIE